MTQASHLAEEIPGYLHSLENHHSKLGRLNAQYHIVNRLQKLTEGNASFGMILGAGEYVLDLLGAVILVVYLLFDLPRVKRGLYQLAPRSRRARMVLLTEEILDRTATELSRYSPLHSVHKIRKLPTTRATSDQSVLSLRRSGSDHADAFTS